MSDAERDDALFREWIAGIRAGDSDAMARAFQRHEGLIGLVARRFPGAADPEDLRQVAGLGLVKALRRFDPDRGVRFSTYAVPIMLGEVRHWLRDRASEGWGRAAWERGRRLEAVLRERDRTGQPWPTVADLAAELNWDVAAVVEALDALNPVPSLDACDGAGQAGTAEEDGWALALDVRSALARLDPSDLSLLQQRLAGVAQIRVAERLHISQAEVSRREARIRARLARILTVR
jgi:RNA polymerase sporulation-specific sigma factor